MFNNLENKRQPAGDYKMPEPIRLNGNETISQAQTEADIDQAIDEKQTEEFLKNKFLQEEAEAKVKQEKGE